MRYGRGLRYSVRMRGQHRAEDWKGSVAHMPDQTPSISEIRAAHEKWGPTIALWQYLRGQGLMLTSVEDSAAKAAEELHGYVLLLLNSVDELLVLRGRIEDHDSHVGSPECYKIGTEVELI